MMKTPVLQEDLKVAEIVKYYPETKDVFIAHGLGAVVSDDGLRVLAPFLSLKTALRSRFISSSRFLELLNEAVNREEVTEAPGLDDFTRQHELTLLALLPCGLKMPLSRTLTSYFQALKKEGSSDITFAVEGNLNQELSYYPYVESVESVDELPDIIISSDFNTFYGSRFYDRFVATGELCGYQPERGGHRRA